MPRALGIARTETSTAHFAFEQMLTAAFDDDAAARACIASALARAGCDRLPDEPDDLMAFTRDHVVPILTEELGPRLVAMLFEDLVAETAFLRRSETRLAHPIGRALRRLTTSSGLSSTATRPANRAKRALAPMPTIQSPEPRDSAPPCRPLVAVAERDRWRRAQVARALVQAGFDVLPLDDLEVLVGALEAGEDAPFDLLITDLVDDLEGRLAALRERRPHLRVLAWTDRSPEEGSSLLAAAGVDGFAFLPRAAPLPRLGDAARRLL
jgi:hypothetical protein